MMAMIGFFIIDGRVDHCCTFVLLDAYPRVDQQRPEALQPMP
jgi:hypothetical protein